MSDAAVPFCAVAPTPAAPMVTAMGAPGVRPEMILRPQPPPPPPAPALPATPPPVPSPDAPPAPPPAWHSASTVVVVPPTLAAGTVKLSVLVKICVLTACEGEPPSARRVPVVLSTMCITLRIF